MKHLDKYNEVALTILLRAREICKRDKTRTQLGAIKGAKRDIKFEISSGALQAEIYLDNFGKTIEKATDALLLYMGKQRCGIHGCEEIAVHTFDDVDYAFCTDCYISDLKTNWEVVISSMKDARKEAEKMRQQAFNNDRHKYPSYESYMKQHRFSWEKK